MILLLNSASGKAQQSGQDYKAKEAEEFAAKYSLSKDVKKRSLPHYYINETRHEMEFPAMECDFAQCKYNF